MLAEVEESVQATEEHAADSEAAMWLPGDTPVQAG
jgi:hypothetical protein